LRRFGAVVLISVLVIILGLGPLLCGTRRDDVKAGLKVWQKRIDRKGCGDLLIELRANRHLAGPKLFALLIGNTAELVGLQLPLEITIEYFCSEPPVANPVDRGLHKLRVDADDRDTLLTGPGQDVIAPRDAD